MRSLRIRPIAHSVKVLTVGALLAAGTAGCVLPGASAADVWTARAKAYAVFQCVSDCTAMETGSVIPSAEVSAAFPSYSGQIGAWPRTVIFHCKYVPNEKDGRVYQVEVNDRNWSGIWEIEEAGLVAIDDSPFSVCSGSPLPTPVVGAR